MSVEFDFDLLFQQPSDNGKEKCKGLRFRGIKNFYVKVSEDNTAGRVVLKQEFRLLKKQSCPGCEKCGWIFDDLREDVDGDFVVFPEEIEDGAVYYIGVTDVSRDLETGYVDEYLLRFLKVEE